MPPAMAAPPAPAPEPPTVTCSASPSTVWPGGVATITATSIGPGNRPLQYSYSASAGTIAGNGATATLSTAGVPPGSVIVTCRVADEAGQVALATTMVTVAVPVAASRPRESATTAVPPHRSTLGVVPTARTGGATNPGVPSVASPAQAASCGGFAVLVYPMRIDLASDGSIADGFTLFAGRYGANGGVPAMVRDAVCAAIAPPAPACIAAADWAAKTTACREVDDLAIAVAEKNVPYAVRIWPLKPGDVTGPVTPTLTPPVGVQAQLIGPVAQPIAGSIATWKWSVTIKNAASTGADAQAGTLHLADADTNSLFEIDPSFTETLQREGPWQRLSDWLNWLVEQAWFKWLSGTTGVAMLTGLVAWVRRWLTGKNHPVAAGGDAPAGNHEGESKSS